MGDAAATEIDDSNNGTDASKDGGKEDTRGDIARGAGADTARDDGEGGAGELPSDTEMGIDACNGPGGNDKQ